MRRATSPQLMWCMNVGAQCFAPHNVKTQNYVSQYKKDNNK